MLFLLSSFHLNAAGSFRVRLRIVSYNNMQIKVIIGKHKGTIDINRLTSSQLEECTESVGDVIVIKLSPGTVKFN